jgi:hypothetical protein
MAQNWLFSPTKEMVQQLWIVVSKLVFGFFVFIIGWIIAKVLKILAAKFLKMVQVNKLVEDSGFREILLRGQITKEPSELIAGVIYWVLIIVVLFIAMTIGGVPIPSNVVGTLLSFIPKIIVALILFILSLFVGNIFEGVVNTAAANAGIEKPYILGKFARCAIIVFGVVLALQEINIASNFITSIFSIIVASAGLAFALAVGLGAKDLVRNWLENAFKKKS